MGTRTERESIYARVTAEMVHAIEAGAADYVMPWHRQSAMGLPRNAATGNRYQGINTVVLWLIAEKQGYTSPYWATYQQWRTVGGQVRRGETGSPVVLYKPRVDQDETVSRGDTEVSKAVLRHSSVFNALQVDGWSCPEPERVDITTRLATVDAFIGALGAEIVYGFSRASYSPKFDRICMPHRSAFVGTETRDATEAFYAVMLHEHVHWSGNPRRLDRNLSDRFGTSGYAMEELVAELGAAFLCADLGISAHPRTDHAAYIATWLQVILEQESAIFTAASNAARACDFLSRIALENVVAPTGVPA